MIEGGLPPRMSVLMEPSGPEPTHQDYRPPYPDPETPRPPDPETQRPPDPHTQTQRPPDPHTQTQRPQDPETPRPRPQTQRPRDPQTLIPRPRDPQTQTQRPPDPDPDPHTQTQRPRDPRPRDPETPRPRPRDPETQRPQTPDPDSNPQTSDQDLQSHQPPAEGGLLTTDPSQLREEDLPGDLQSLSWLTSVDVPRLQQMVDGRGLGDGAQGPRGPACWSSRQVRQQGTSRPQDTPTGRGLLGLAETNWAKTPDSSAEHHDHS
ncbi:unnamed protein product [Gadus morhua 'NCC']